VRLARKHRDLSHSGSAAGSKGPNSPRTTMRPTRPRGSPSARDRSRTIADSCTGEAGEPERRADDSPG
jgi:hypothetical protein